MSKIIKIGFVAIIAIAVVSFFAFRYGIVGFVGGVLMSIGAIGLCSELWSALHAQEKPDEDNYIDFSDGLKDFKLQNGEKETAPLYDDTHFDFPTYILQWTEVGEKWEVLEYVMLDNENNTVVFVYTMSELEYIEKNSAYNVTPTEMHFLDENFSIYDNFEDSTYDISLLEYLK